MRRAACLSRPPRPRHRQHCAAWFDRSQARWRPRARWAVCRPRELASRDPAPRSGGLPNWRDRPTARRSPRAIAAACWAGPGGAVGGTVHRAAARYQQPYIFCARGAGRRDGGRRRRPTWNSCWQSWLGAGNGCWRHAARSRRCRTAGRPPGAQPRSPTRWPGSVWKPPSGTGSSPCTAASPTSGHGLCRRATDAAGGVLHRRALDTCAAHCGVPAMQACTHGTAGILRHGGGTTRSGAEGCAGLRPACWRPACSVHGSRRGPAATARSTDARMRRHLGDAWRCAAQQRHRRLLSPTCGGGGWPPRHPLLRDGWRAGDDRRPAPVAHRCVLRRACSASTRRRA